MRHRFSVNLFRRLQLWKRQRRDSQPAVVAYYSTSHNSSRLSLQGLVSSRVGTLLQYDQMIVLPASRLIEWGDTASNQIHSACSQGNTIIFLLSAQLYTGIMWYFHSLFEAGVEGACDVFSLNHTLILFIKL